MPKQNEIRTLADQALAELAKIIVQTIGGNEALDEDLATIIITSYLTEGGATPDIYQDLLRGILASDSLEASIRFGCLRALLTNGVQSLATGIFPFNYYEKILRVIADQGCGLRHLNLKGVWVKDEHMTYMVDIVHRLQEHLAILSIPYIANDDLLEEIGHTCRNLKILDIAGETDITDIGLHAIATGVCQGLTYIDIGMMREENICHEDVALLIEHQPHLTKIGTYSYVGRAIRFIHKAQPKFRCRLRYVRDTETSSDALDSIIECCPELESLYLDTPTPGSLHKLSGVGRLQQLKLYKFSCEELMSEVLPKIGFNLQQLTLTKGRGQCDLGLLAKRCPLLLELECYLMDLMTFACDGVFHVLEGLEVLQSCMNNFALKAFIAAHAKTLQRLGVDQVSFKDEDIRHIFLNHRFERLEEVWFTSAPHLTLEAVEVFMQLPQLRSLGQMTGWAMHYDDLQFLKGIVKSRNMRLALSPSAIVG